MTDTTRRRLLAGGLATLALPASAVPAPAAPARAAPDAVRLVRAAAGTEVTTPHNRVPSELANEASELPGRVRLGARTPNVTIYEFFDYNCPWCRKSCQDARALIEGEADLAYVLVNFAVLGAPSIEAARIALAYARQTDGKGYFALHEKLFSLKGTVNGQRAYDAARALGADGDRLLKDADSDVVTAAMKAAVNLGNNLGFTATPTYLVLTEAYHGYLPLADKRRIVANVRGCEAVVC
ncbi:thioredoxin domain-containing protein [Chelatococcus sp. SYSU_G07232]|uniref:Thioredoxin domain-containing protein n=1 Tax=Chelatococcus albus TaxID=3047466 RepID=A0ABT7AHE3_9HYPH|nr:thioredoxin domain-containing protein [Chelatococcus sp. SYSU_G07232]MDJ1158768.1 thioredoxin domain-containing protein [Chelatococcus sp. SYSU_G07232]